MTYQSKYNHLVKLSFHNQENKFVLMNLFNGASVFINRNYCDILHKKWELGESDLDRQFEEYLIEKGYLYTTQEGEKEFINKTFKNKADRDELSANLKGGYYGFITSLYCNLKCQYCFQQEKADTIGFLSEKHIDKALEIIKRCEDNIKNKYNLKETVPKISITGGEPLLMNKKNISALKYLLARLHFLNYPYSITTNGTTLFDFSKIIEKESNCRNIQVTLDGPDEIHNKRRFYRNGKGSFKDIDQGIDYCLSQNWKITLRVNLDMMNVQHLPSLAHYVKSKWSGNPHFYSYVSPITDHGNLGNYDTPKDESDLLEALLAIIVDNPIVKEVFDIKHFRGFNYVEQILINKEPKFPVIFRCEAVSGMYIFAPDGKVYVCLESVGSTGLEVGTYYPKWEIQDESAKMWSQRNALTIKKCENCKICFICAGGCSIEAFNKTDKSICMPFLREIEIAWNYYAKARPDLFCF